MISSNRDFGSLDAVAAKILETAVDSIISIDEVGTVLSFNPAAERMTGYERQEIVGQNIRSLMPSPFQEEHDGYLAKYLETGVAKIIGIGREIVIVRKDGSEFPADLSVSEVDDVKDRIFTGVLRDLTEAKKRESELLRANEKAEQQAAFGALLDRSLNEIYLFDAETLNFVHVNRGAKVNLGYTMEELRQLTPIDLKPEHTAASFTGLTAPLLDGTQARIEFDTVHRRKDASEYPVQVSLEVSHFSGRSVFAATILDVTERKRWEDQVQHSQKLESLGILAGGIAHDFNNLLMGVLGHSSLMLQQLPPNSPVQSSVEDIQSASLRATDLCKQMLAYSGKGRFIVQALSLTEVVGQFGHLLEIGIPKNVVLKYELQENLPAIQADASQMQQLVMNLITNAAEAVGDASGVVTLATGAMTADTQYLKSTYLDDELPSGDYVYYEVSDTGCGMTEAVKQKLFDPFFSTKFTGRGLGLAALLGIVRGHRGAVKVYSEPDKGTTFKVLFPAIDSEAVSIVKPVPVLNSWQGEGTVLVVDDDETARTVSRRILESGGFTTLVACDGLEGIDVFENHQNEIVCVLLDMTMPRMDGVATFQRLKQLDPDIKVVLTSGYNEQDATSRFAGKGLSGFIQKPYQPGELLQLMELMLVGEDEQEQTEHPAESTMLIIDDEEIVLNVFSSLFEARGCRVLTASTGAEALDVYRLNYSHIGLVLLDRNLNGTSGRKILSELKAINQDARVALCSGDDLQLTTSGEQLNGATAIVPKSLRPAVLVETVLSLMNNTNPDSK
jgi:two-component system, cell cycle sensor histidine kinase and response regulator CckA